MSRVGLSPVNIPDGVIVALSGNEMTAKGKFGELSLKFVDELEYLVSQGCHLFMFNESDLNGAIVICQFH